MKFALQASPSRDQKHRLDPVKIIETAKNLAADIKSRLPGSRLADLAGELVWLAGAADERGRQSRRPNYAIRIVSALMVGAALLTLGYLAHHIRTRSEPISTAELFVAADAGINLMILLAGALWFCVTLEARIKRTKALGFLEELREFVHVVDVTQLYYTPDFYRIHPETPRSSLALDDTYLLFCTQMLAVIGNLAPLYTRGMAADSVLRAASEIEMLTIAVSAKHFTKADLVRSLIVSSRTTASPSEDHVPPTGKS